MAINVILKLAGYTYRPLLGVLTFGLITNRTLRDRWVPLVAVAGPVSYALLEYNQAALLGSYRLGLELMSINGILVFAGLVVILRGNPDKPWR